MSNAYAETNNTTKTEYITLEERLREFSNMLSPEDARKVVSGFIRLPAYLFLAPLPEQERQTYTTLLTNCGIISSTEAFLLRQQRPSEINPEELRREECLFKEILNRYLQLDIPSICSEDNYYSEKTFDYPRSIEHVFCSFLAVPDDRAWCFIHDMLKVAFYSGSDFPQGARLRPKTFSSPNIRGNLTMSDLLLYSARYSLDMATLHDANSADPLKFTLQIILERMLYSLVPEQEEHEQEEHCDEE